MHVAVGTTSNLKILAVRAAYQRLDIESSLSLSSVNVSSGVSDQPFGSAEMSSGAITRARKALEHFPYANLAIGIESGIVKDANVWFEGVWVTSIRPEGRLRHECHSQGTRIPLPEWFIDEIQNIDKEQHPFVESGELVKWLAGGGQKDPALYFSAGRMSRGEILTQAIFWAIMPQIELDRYASITDVERGFLNERGSTNNSPIARGTPEFEEMLKACEAK